MSYTDRLNYLHLHSLKGRRMRGDLIEVYKIFHAHIDLQWDHFFEAAKTDQTRNSEGKIFVKQFHSNMGKSTFSNSYYFFFFCGQSAVLKPSVHMLSGTGWCGAGLPPFPTAC